jgi:hypothetical protein
MQEREKTFLDPELPQTEDELVRQIKNLNKQHGELRRKQEQLGDSSQAEWLEMSTQMEELISLRDRMTTQKTNLLAGTKIVSRLTATGRARQLVSDEEHVTSAQSTLLAVLSSMHTCIHLSWVAPVAMLQSVVKRVAWKERRLAQHLSQATRCFWISVNSSAFVSR